VIRSAVGLRAGSSPLAQKRSRHVRVSPTAFADRPGAGPNLPQRRITAMINPVPLLSAAGPALGTLFTPLMPEVYLLLCSEHAKARAGAATAETPTAHAR